jgi:hypothetical protein
MFCSIIYGVLSSTLPRLIEMMLSNYPIALSHDNLMTISQNIANFTGK